MSNHDSTNDSLYSTRRILVDDADAQIVYDGPWQVDTRGVQDRVGNFGPTFGGTLHGIVGTEASFSFQYDGSSARVYGSLQGESGSGVGDPSWRCFLDGQEHPVPPIVPFSLNNWELCRFRENAVGEGVHNLTVRVSSRSRYFWLDYITYNPSPNPRVIAPVAFARIQDRDRAISYDNTWSPLSDIGRYTNAQNGSVRVRFLGTALSWYGAIPHEMPQGTTFGTYSLDGEPSVPFEIGLEDRSDITRYNQLLFTTRNVVNGIHTLTVTYGGTTDRTPLVLDYLIIHDSTASGSAASPNPQQNSTNPTTSDTNEMSALGGSSKPSAGTIAGAVIGSLVLLALLVVGAIFGRRWHRKRTRPKISPMPGYAPSDEPRPPLDFDAPQRYSVELEERMQIYGSPFPAHLRTPRSTRQFNPEVRSTITSVDFDTPAMQHATMGIPGWGLERERDSMFSTQELAPPTPPPKDARKLGASPLAGTTSPAPTPARSNEEDHGIREGSRITGGTNAASESQVALTTLDPYAAGYPFASNAPGLSPYEQLVAATKAQEAERERRKARSRRHKNGYA